jgi:hypothetical protein
LGPLIGKGWRILPGDPILIRNTISIDAMKRKSYFSGKVPGMATEDRSGGSSSRKDEESSSGEEAPLP